MNGSEAPRTPLMAFLVEFLRGNPDASFQEVRTAAAAQNFQVAPINYGNARRILGMAAKARTSRGTGRRRIRQAVESGADGAAAPAVGSARGRRGRKRKLDFSNLSNLVEELQDVVAERDRLLAALDQIAGIIKNI